MSALAELHFLRPLWLAALAVLPLLWWWWRRRNRDGNPWRRVVDADLLPALLEQRGDGVRRTSPGGLLVLLPLLAILALAGPAWRKAPQPLLRADSALVIALDLSDRMLAADLAPSRLQRARFKLMDLLRAREDGQVGLVAFAGDAFTVAPLTSDYATLQSLLASLDPEVMPVPGQRVDRAIDRSTRLIEDAGFSRGRILLLTDRADTAAIDAARDAAARGIETSVLGIGTAQGAPVPLPGGSFATDTDGSPLMAALDRDALTALAAAGGGTFAAITADPSDLRRLDVLAADGGERAVEGDALPRYHDDGPWLVLLLLPLAALAFRRGWLGCLPLLLCLPVAPAQALDWSALWWRDEQRAQQALEHGDHERARALSDDPARQGSAAYRAGDYAAAAAAFAGANDADGHYNRGNALARAGQLEDAISAYDEALARQPGMDDAIANRAAVEALLQQQQQQQEQEQNRDQQQAGDDAGKPEPSSDGQPQQPADGEDGESEPSGERDSEPSSQGQPGEQDRDPSPSSEGDSPDDTDAPIDDPASPDPADAQAEQDALRQQIDQALQQGEGEPASPADAAADSAAERSAREKMQSTEMLLRRVPDDPGGLLRRKFAIEHRQRVIEGQGGER